MSEHPGVVESSTTVGMPAEHAESRSERPASSEPVSDREVKEAFVGALARKDDMDASSYVAERNWQDREDKHGAPDNEFPTSRLERIREAREQLRRENSELRQGDQRFAHDDADRQVMREVEQADQWRAHVEDVAARERAVGAFEARCQSYAQSNPDFAATEIFQYAPLQNTGAIDALVASEVGPEIMSMIANSDQSIDVIDQLNGMSPEDARLWIARLEVKAHMDRQARQQQPLQQQTQRRLQTQAPRPIRPPSGGATASRSLHELAKGDDMAAYVAARDKQDAAARQR